MWPGTSSLSKAIELLPYESLFDCPLAAMDSQSSSYSSHDPSPEGRMMNHMIFPQHIPLPQMNTFTMIETGQLQYDTSRGECLQANPQPMNLAGPDMDMLMQDIDISNFSLADIDALCPPQNGLNGMLQRHRRLNIPTDAYHSQ